MLFHQTCDIFITASDLRLLRGTPGNEGDPVECSVDIRRIFTTGSERYLALSYGWGDTSALMPILLNRKSFYVTRNLYTALQNLRCRSGVPLAGESLGYDEAFWIDAICINQDDATEQHQQVVRMKSIYKNAHKVVIWLGQHNEPEDEDFMLYPDIWGIDSLQRGNIQTTKDGLKSALKLSALSKMDHPKRIDGYSDVTARVSLVRLLRREWFDRLWVIQELALAQDAEALCGSEKISWKDFERAAAFLLRPGYDESMTSRKFIMLMASEHVHQVTLPSAKKTNILSILRYTQQSQCSDPRDKLYALLGILRDDGDIVVDYEKLWDVIYKTWALNRIKRTKSLDIFSAYADSGSHGLPSWVPDLRHE
jgi:hypothetical protein